MITRRLTPSLTWTQQQSQTCKKHITTQVQQIQRGEKQSATIKTYNSDRRFHVWLGHININESDGNVRSMLSDMSNENEFDQEVSRINTTHTKFKYFKFSVPYRLNRFDKIFQKCINSSKVNILSVLQTQRSQYTFNSGYTKSLIDHIVAADSNFKNITPTCNIIDDTIHSLNSPSSINLSDHCLVELVFKFYGIETNRPQDNNNPELKWIPNWKSEKVSKKFMDILDNLQS
jgi:hypothetical protein